MDQTFDPPRVVQGLEVADRRIIESGQGKGGGPVARGIDQEVVAYAVLQVLLMVDNRNFLPPGVDGAVSERSDSRCHVVPAVSPLRA